MQFNFSHPRTNRLLLLQCSRGGRFFMKKYRLTLTYDEWRTVINALNDLRSSLIREGRYTDPVDDVMIKVINARTKRFYFREV